MDKKKDHPKNANTFSKDTHDEKVINEQVYNNDGYDIYGFDKNGYNREGFTIDGVDHRNFHKDGKTIFGHSFYATEFFGNGTVGGYNHDGEEIYYPLEYGESGIDQMGYCKSLPYAHPDRDERYSVREGFNREGKNFLGLSYKDFKKNSYDAILEIELVKNYPNNIHRLIDRFNGSCFQIELYDIFGFKQVKINSNNFIDILYNYNDAGMEDPIGHFLAGRMRSEKDLSPQVEDELKSYLKKGIYFCEEFLFSGKLKEYKNKLKFDDLKTNITGRYFKDMEIGLDYKNRFELMYRHNPIDYLSVIKNAMLDPEILKKAFYSEKNDECRNKWHDINNFIEAYKHGNVLSGHQAKLYLYLLGIKISKLSQDAKIAIASLFLHGGAHCMDAKRQALAQAFISYANEDYEKLVLAQKQIFGEESLEAAIKNHILPIKKYKFHAWIETSLGSRGGIDVASGLAGVWNQYAKNLGLMALGNAHCFQYGLEYAQLFCNEKEVNETWKTENPTLNGGLTKELIYYYVYPKTKRSEQTININDTNIMVDISSKIFGPFWHMIDKQKNPIKPSSDQICPEHPIMNALSVRIGLLTL